MQTKKGRDTSVLTLAQKTEKATVRRELTKEEADGLKDDFFAKQLALSQLEDDKKQKLEEFKLEMDPLKKDCKRLMRHIADGFIDTQEEVHLVPTDDGLRYEMYDSDGTHVGFRNMTSEERKAYNA